MSTEANPYDPPQAVPEPESHGEGPDLPPVNPGDWYGSAVLLLGIAFALLPSILCCWPAALLIGMVGVVAGVNAYNRSENQTPRVLAIGTIVMSVLGIAIALWCLAISPFRN